MKSIFTALVVAGALVVLGAANHTIWKRQQIVDDGLPVLLELRPVDPRSLMQGDFMALRYAEELFPDAAARSDLPRRGAFIVALDERGVASYARIDDGSDLQAGEARLRYKLLDKHGQIRLGAESFFFEEGQADVYAGARFGVLHVDENGRSVLVGLADEDGHALSPPSQ